MDNSTHCPMDVNPVITPDGKKFSNSCVAERAGYTTYTKLREKTMQTATTGQMSTLDHVLNVGLIFTGVSVLVLVGILIFKKK